MPLANAITAGVMPEPLLTRAESLNHAQIQSVNTVSTKLMCGEVSPPFFFCMCLIPF